MPTNNDKTLKWQYITLWENELVEKKQIDKGDDFEDFRCFQWYVYTSLDLLVTQLN